MMEETREDVKRQEKTPVEIRRIWGTSRDAMALPMRRRDAFQEFLRALRDGRLARGTSWILEEREERDGDTITVIFTARESEPGASGFMVMG